MIKLLSSYIEQIKAKKRQHNYLEKQLEKDQKERDVSIKELSDLEDKAKSYDNLIYTCKLVLKKITQANKVKLEDFLTEAVRSIFVDRDYKIELVLRDDTKRPGLELTLTESGVQQEITDAVGGGIISTLGLLLQIYYIEVYNLNKIMFIDEGLKEISTGLNNESTESVNYLDNLLRFLQFLAKEKEYSLVIVTHDNNVRQFADKVYEIRLGEVA